MSPNKTCIGGTVQVVPCTWLRCLIFLFIKYFLINRGSVMVRHLCLGSIFGILFKSILLSLGISIWLMELRWITLVCALIQFSTSIWFSIVIRDRIYFSNSSFSSSLASSYLCCKWSFLILNTSFKIVFNCLRTVLSEECIMVLSVESV